MLRRLLIGAFTFFLCAFANAQESNTSRHFNFHYAFTVKNVTKGEKLRVWIPLAHSDAYQDVKVTSMKGDLPLRETKESEYGNSMLYASTPKATKDEYAFAVDYDVVRREHVVLVSGKPESTVHTAPLTQTQLKRFLEPDRLVPVTGLPAQLAAQTTKGDSSELEKAHAIYQYVLANMRYDKTGTGWGHGDTLFACDAKRGNCTDFHSLFISMARSQDIPSRFEIGFPLPAAKHSADIAGYHCWAEFYLNGTGWTPVDISEAWKDQTKRDYFFGAHDTNRVQFTVGRDIKLNPKQDGEALNYFVFPYVELGGKEWENVSNAFSFADEAGTALNASNSMR